MLETGRKAPEFTLPDQNGEMRSLADYKGQKVILYFYPKDMTSGCTKQACGFAELYPQFQEKGAVVLKKAAIKVNFESINKPLVVLANPKTRLNDRYANKEIKDKLVRADQLIARIQKANEQSDEPRCSLNEMIDFGKRWLSRSTEHDGFEDKYHRYVSRVEDALKMERQYNSAAGALVCPKCGGTLILRTAKKGPFAGNQFYGCSNYYSKGCTFTLNVKQ